MLARQRHGPATARRRPAQREQHPPVQSLADRLIRSPGGAAIGYTLEGVVAHNDRNYEILAIAAFEHVLELDPELRVSCPCPARSSGATSPTT